MITKELEQRDDEEYTIFRYGNGSLKLNKEGTIKIFSNVWLNP